MIAMGRIWFPEMFEKFTNRVNGSGDAHSDPNEEPAEDGGRH